LGTLGPPPPRLTGVAAPWKHAPTPHVVVVVVVVEIFIHSAVKATVTNAPQSQLNK